MPNGCLFFEKKIKKIFTRHKNTIYLRFNWTMENDLFRIIIASQKKLIYLQYKILAKMRRQGIVERIRSEASKIKPKVQTILYGSEARGDARPDSDIDLLMLVDADKLTYSEKDSIIAPFYDIELDTGVISALQLCFARNGKTDLLLLLSNTMLETKE